MYITVQDISQSVLPYEKTAVGVRREHSRVQSPAVVLLDTPILAGISAVLSVCLSPVSERARMGVSSRTRLLWSLDEG